MRREEVGQGISSLRHLLVKWNDRIPPPDAAGGAVIDQGLG